MRLLPLSLIAAFVLVAAACGANPAPSDDVAGSGPRTKAAGTFRSESITRFSGYPMAERYEVRTIGVSDYLNDRFEYRTEPGGCRAIMIGDVTYSESPVEEGFPAGKHWMKFDGARVGSEAEFEQSFEQSQQQTTDAGGMVTAYSVAVFSSPEPTPDEYLDDLRETSGEPERVGEEDVRGVSTTRYHSTIDVHSSTRRMLEAEGWKSLNIERYLEDIQAVREIDVWVDDDGLVRRTVDTETPAPGALTWIVTTEYFDFGLDAEIQAPPAAEVLTPEELQRVTDEQNRAYEREIRKWRDELPTGDDEATVPLPGAFEPSAAGSFESPSCSR